MASSRRQGSPRWPLVFDMDIPNFRSSLRAAFNGGGVEAVEDEDDIGAELPSGVVGRNVLLPLEAEERVPREHTDPELGEGSFELAQPHAAIRRQDLLSCSALEAPETAAADASRPTMHVLGNRMAAALKVSRSFLYAGVSEISTFGGLPNSPPARYSTSAYSATTGGGGGGGGASALQRGTPLEHPNETTSPQHASPSFATPDAAADAIRRKTIFTPWAGEPRRHQIDSW